MYKKTSKFFLTIFSLLIIFCGQGCLGSEDDDNSQLPVSKPPKSHQNNTPSSPTKPRTTSGNIGDICADINAEPEPPVLKKLSELKDRFLDSHNDMRNRYKLSPLQWDNGIAAYAQRWADHLKQHRDCKMQHRSVAGITEGKSYGENLAWNWHPRAGLKSGTFISSPENSVLLWTQECKDYNYQNNSCVTGKQCGHFTQVVWNTSVRVGCGMAICDHPTRGRAEVWVCNYDPPGNIVMISRSGKRTPLKPF